MEAVKEKLPTDYAVANDVIGFKILFVNVYMIGTPGNGNPWVLVDAGLPGSAKRIKEEAAKYYGENNPPKAIVLTHGHFDHVGALADLLDSWKNVKVYAHPLEIPYLTGKASYPPPDPTAGNGAMAYMSWLFPVKPINIKDRVEPLAEGGKVPELPDWGYIHTPGHSPGHISLFQRKRQNTDCRRCFYYH
ncbi:MAG: MBL fold metallo-hydrolase [Cytophagaceae bacterium]